MMQRWLVISQLDRQLSEWQKLGKKFPKPSVGWLRTLRLAFNMTTEYLAQKVGVNHSRILHIEKGEVDDTITLQTLKKVADAMECELIYAIVPKNNLSLEKIIRNHASELALEITHRVGHTMALEDQSVSKEFLQQQTEETAKILAKNLDKKFWKKKPKRG